MNSICTPGTWRWAGSGRATIWPMPLLNEEAPALPLDAQGILELAARSMFQLFSSVSQGMFLVDRTCRIV